MFHTLSDLCDGQDSVVSMFLSVTYFQFVLSLRFEDAHVRTWYGHELN